MVNILMIARTGGAKAGGGAIWQPDQMVQQLEVAEWQLHEVVQQLEE